LAIAADKNPLPISYGIPYERSESGLYVKGETKTSPFMKEPALPALGLTESLGRQVGRHFGPEGEIERDFQELSHICFALLHDIKF